MEANVITKEKLLEAIPQKPPFRFIDDILEISDKHIIGKYTFKENEFFYSGHFPGNPITPGVIILEAMAQTGVVALGMYIEMLNNRPVDRLTLFTEANIEFLQKVLPNETILVYGELIYHRRNKIKSRVEVKKIDGTVVASGELAGVAVSS